MRSGVNIHLKNLFLTPLFVFLCPLSLVVVGTSLDCAAGSYVPVASGVQALSPGDPRGQIYGDPNFRQVDLSDFHEKANENITLQIDYINQKVDFLRDPAKDPRQKVKLLGGFCGDANSSNLINEQDLKACINDYSDLMDFWKLKAFSNIGLNNRDRGKILCKSFAVDGSCIASLDVVIAREEGSDPDQNKKAQIPAFATAKQLADFSKIQTLVKATDEVDWREDMFKALEPQQGDFRFYDTRVLDGGPMKVPMDSSHGSKSYDGVDFRQAQVDWVALYQRIQQEHPKGTKRLSSRELRKQLIQEFGADVQPQDRSDSRLIYEGARRINVRYTNANYLRIQGLDSSTGNGKRSSRHNQNSAFDEADLDAKLANPLNRAYLGNEEVVAPSVGPNGQQMGEAAVIYNPEARPVFKRQSGPNASQLGGAQDDSGSSVAGQGLGPLD
jgi:hypothetical protein